MNSIINLIIAFIIIVLVIVALILYKQPYKNTLPKPKQDNYPEETIGEIEPLTEEEFKKLQEMLKERKPKTKEEWEKFQDDFGKWLEKQ